VNKQFLWTVTAIYAAGMLLGVLLFHSPSMSKGYMEKYGAEHERYLKIFKSEMFKAYEERPDLYPPQGHFKEDVEFVEHYVSRPEFIAEEHRIFWFVEFMKVLNSGVFIAYLAGLIGKPMLKFLDDSIQQIKSSFEEAAKARREAQEKRAAAQAKMSEWSAKEAKIQEESESTVARHLAKIHEEAENAQALLKKQTEDRKQAELYVAARAIKTELVNEALRKLEERYKNELTLEKLNSNVDRFTTLMDRLS